MDDIKNEALVSLISTACDLANSVRDDLLDDGKYSDETKYLLKVFRDKHEKISVMLDEEVPVGSLQ